jgi:bifunctional DNA-binding transcriptional regulator/antitoxin component of YhaV-PrlF toxin-antitoxin module
MAVAIRGPKERRTSKGRKSATVRGEEALSVRVDDKSRFRIPAAFRQALGVGPGTVLFIKREGDFLYLAKAENPFDGLARYAIAEDDAGRGRSLRDYARERNIKLSDE